MSYWRAVNTTGNHPYLVKLNTKEECDKYLNNGFNNQYTKDNYSRENGCFRWVEVKYLDEIAVPIIKNEVDK